MPEAFLRELAESSSGLGEAAPAPPYAGDRPSVRRPQDHPCQMSAGRAGGRRRRRRGWKTPRSSAPDDQPTSMARRSSVAQGVTESRRLEGVVPASSARPTWTRTAKTVPTRSGYCQQTTLADCSAPGPTARPAAWADVRAQSTKMYRRVVPARASTCVLDRYAERPFSRLIGSQVARDRPKLVTSRSPSTQIVFSHGWPKVPSEKSSLRNAK